MMRKNLPVIAALLIGAAVALAGVLVLGGDDEQAPVKAAAQERPVFEDGRELVGPEESWTLQYPQGWKPLKASEIGADAGVPAAAVRRQQGDALLIVEQRGRLRDGLENIEQELTKELRRQFKGDFRFVRANELELPAGKAVSYTFVRTKSGQVQNMVVVPEKDRSYTLNSVVAGDATDAAREVAQIVRTFDPET